MPATTRTSRPSASSHARLPMSPRVTTGRRGSHVPIRSETVDRPAGAPATPAMHVTPEVVIAARGSLSLADKGHSLSATVAGGALDVRRMRI